MSVTIAQPISQQANLPINPKFDYIPAPRPNMRIETETIDPIVNQAKSYIRFQLPTKGILDNTSQIVFTLNNGDGNNDDKMTFPFYTGAYSMINRAVLSAPNGKVINEMSRMDIWKTLDTKFRTKENAILKEQFTKNSSPDTHYLRTFPNAVDYTNGAGLESSQAYPDYGLAVAGNQSFNYLNQGCRRSNHQFGYNSKGLSATQTQEVSFTLAELFPFFENNTFKSFEYDKSLIIELFLNDSNYTVVGTANNNAANASWGVSKVVLQADIVYYDENTMNEIASQDSSNSTLGIMKGVSYHTMNVPASQANQVQQIRMELPVANLLIDKIYIIKQVPLVGQDLKGGGAYDSIGFTNGESFNLRINDETIFDTDVVNTALQYSLISQVDYGNVLEVMKGQYDVNLTNVSGDINMNGSYHVLGVDLGSGGRRVGINPVELFYNRNTTNQAQVQAQTTLHVFVCYKEQFSASVNQFDVANL